MAGFNPKILRGRKRGSCIDDLLMLHSVSNFIFWLRLVLISIVAGTNPEILSGQRGVDVRIEEPSGGADR